MLTLQIALKMITMLCIVGAAVMIVVHEVRSYRVLVVIAVGATAVGSSLELGLLSGLLLVFAIGVAMPVAILAMSRTIVWLSWHNVRQQYPAESTHPPCKRLTLAGAYRLMWLA